MVESGVPTRISTVTGSFLAHAHRVALGVLAVEVEATLYFAEEKIPRCHATCLDKPAGSTECVSPWSIMTGSFYLSHYDDPA